MTLFRDRNKEVIGKQQLVLPDEAFACGWRVPTAAAVQGVADLVAGKSAYCGAGSRVL